MSNVNWRIQEFKVLQHKVGYRTPVTSEDFNSLDTKRVDAARDEAVSNIVYRSMNPWTRFWFLHGIKDEECKKLIADGKLDPAVTPVPYEGAEAYFETLMEGVEYDQKDKDEGNDTPSRKTEVAKNAKGETKMKDGVEVTRFIEAEEGYYNRVLGQAVKYKKFGSEDAARAHFDPIIALIATYVPFDPTEAEGGERGPRKLAGKYKLAAAKVLALGNVDKVNKNMLSKVPTPDGNGDLFVASGDMTKLFTGKYPTKDATGNEVLVDFSVSDKDAEGLGWKIKGYQDWKSSQELVQIAE